MLQNEERIIKAHHISTSFLTLNQSYLWLIVKRDYLNCKTCVPLFKAKMPYYTREMVRWMKQQEKQQKSDSSPREKKRSRSSAENVTVKTAGGGGLKMNANEANSQQRVLRITPSHIDWDASKVAVAKFEAPKKVKEMTFDEKRLKYMRNLLRLQVDRINRIECTLPTSSKEYEKYIFNWNQPIRKGEHSQASS